MLIVDDGSIVTYSVTVACAMVCAVRKETKRRGSDRMVAVNRCALRCSLKVKVVQLAETRKEW